VDKIRLAVALVVLLAYLGAMVLSARDHSYEFPPGLAYLAGVAVVALLGSPVLKGIKGLTIDLTQKKEDTPDES
jgi:hypothetical protein